MELATVAETARVPVLVGFCAMASAPPSENSRAAHKNGRRREVDFLCICMMISLSFLVQPLLVCRGTVDG